ncbi:MAG: M20/M25/M40 family metallo-hydrolase [Candidatus Hodarchaeota archaeon]
MDIFNDEQKQKEVTELLQKLIRANTTNPPGNEIVAARILDDYYSSYGLHGEFIESEKDRASFYMEIPGKNPKNPTLMLMSHLDVVYANPEEWDHPPFGAEIYDGFLYGRGAMDTKGLVAVQAVALANLYNEGHEFKGTVKVLNEADEEMFGTKGVKWLVKNHPEKCKADLVLNEGGGNEVPKLSGIPLKFKRPMLLIETACKGVFWIELKIKGVAAHGSIAEYTKNPIMKLRKILSAIYHHKKPIEITPLFKKMLKSLPLNGFLKAFLGSKFIMKLLVGNPAKSFSSLKIFVQSTISPNIVRGGEKENVIPDEVTVTLDCRQLPGRDLEYLMKFLKEITNKYKDDVIITPKLCTVGNESPFDHEYYRMIEELIDKEYDMDIMPYLLPGGEDTVYLRPLGNISYGFFPMRADAEVDLLEIAHGKNELISLNNLYLGTDFYYKFIKKFSSM